MAYEYPLKQKYRTKHVSKNVRPPRDGNGGGTGRRAKAAKRGHGGGKETPEQKAESERQSREHNAWRQTWGVSRPETPEEVAEREAAWVAS